MTSSFPTRRSSVLPGQQALAAGFFSQRISVIAVDPSIIACEQSAIGLQLAEIDPVILALEIMDHAAQDGDDVEFLAVDPRDVRDRKAIAGEIGRHLVLEDKTGMDLETLTAAQMDVFKVFEKAGELVDIAE